MSPNADKDAHQPGSALDPKVDEMVRHQLLSRGIEDERVLEAMASVPRDRFVPSSSVDSAYSDCALPIACEQTISQPYMVALSCELAHITASDRVLEIGTGSGYQAAILSRLAREVITIERHENLARHAKATLEDLGIGNVTVVEGDGTLGVEQHAPFDAIIMTAAAPRAPKALLSQLAIGARLVGPIGTRDKQHLEVHRRINADEYAVLRSIPCRYVPMIGADGWLE